jgi:hypothetical protein
MILRTRPLPFLASVLIAVFSASLGHAQQIGGALFDIVELPDNVLKYNGSEAMPAGEEHWVFGGVGAFLPSGILYEWGSQEPDDPTHINLLRVIGYGGTSSLASIEVFSDELVSQPPSFPVVGDGEAEIFSVSGLPPYTTIFFNVTFRDEDGEPALVPDSGATYAMMLFSLGGLGLAAGRFKPLSV